MTREPRPLRSLLRGLIDEPVRGGARWAYVFGSALVFLLLAQFSSGLALQLSYAPSVATAWASVAALEATQFGHLLRALHAWGATFIVVASLAHLLQTALYGAYRAQRAATWWLGVALLLVLLAFCLTGSLLPYDERGYWATRVSVGIAESAPLIGALLGKMLTGGAEIGNPALTRFNALHVTLLPLSLLLLGALHVALMRKSGVTPRAPIDEAKTEPFWPRQALYDSLAALALLSALLAVALVKGAPLLGPADPAGASNPRPDWYFRPLFEALKLAPARLEPLAAFGLPLAGLALLCALPKIRSHRLGLSLLGAALALTAALGVASVRADARDPLYAASEKEALLRAQKAMKLARDGVPPEGALAMLQNQPEERGSRLFARACAECHADGAHAPDLAGYLSKQWIRAALVQPDQLYGTAKLTGMESYGSLGEEKLAQLIDFLSAQRTHAPDDPALDSQRRAFHAQGCADCHALQAGPSDGGPGLAGYGSKEWLLGLLRDPGSAAYYGAQNRMPAFGSKLSAQDLDDLIAFLVEREGDEPALARSHTP